MLLWSTQEPRHPVQVQVQGRLVCFAGLGGRFVDGAWACEGRLLESFLRGKSPPAGKVARGGGGGVGIVVVIGDKCWRRQLLLRETM